MKNILLFFALSVVFTASAELNGNGYYRVKNYKSERYIYVMDDKGSLNFQATTAELGAIELYKNPESVIYDPATVMYVYDLDGKNRDFDIQSQGTGVKAIIDYPVSIIKSPKFSGTHYVFGRNSGVARYIGDGAVDTSTDKGAIADGASPDSNGFAAWYFLPITPDSNEYFGILPEFNIGNDYYSSFYAGFPFSFASEGMSAYIITKVGNGMACMKEIKGTIPQGTPVLIKCKSAQPSGNKLSIGGIGNVIKDNQLKGIYFNIAKMRHINRTQYDPDTMRVLGKMSDGSLGFVTAKYEYLPRNKAYIVVPKGTPSELRIVSESEFTGLNTIGSDASSVTVEGSTLYVSGEGTYDVYSIAGQNIYHGSDASVTLPSPGIYLVKTANSVTKIVAK